MAGQVNADPEEWFPGEGYSYTRFNDTLNIFRAAEQQDADDGSMNAADQLISNRGDPFVDFDDLEDGEDGDYTYNPRITSAQINNKKPKRRADGTSEDESPKKPKRKADGAPNDESPKKTKSNTGVLPKEERLADRNAYITFPLASPKAREFQEELVAKFGNDVQVIKPNHAEDGRTYTEKLDDESAQIPNQHGRALRNGKIVEILQPRKSLRCPRCAHIRDDCQCHLALIQRKDTSEDRPHRGPSVVPIVPRAPDASLPAFTGLLTPTLKGKERAPSLSPPPVNMVTPPRTASQDSISSNRSFSNSPLQPTQVRHEAKGSTPEDPIDLDDDEDDEDDVFVDDPATLHAAAYAEEIVLKTHWSHPIDFKLTSEKIPCKFCQNIRYGIYGEIERVITVIEDPGSDALQYIEVATEGTHLPEQTRMCVFCALSRLHIVNCPGHSYRIVAPPQGQRRESYIEQISSRKNEILRKPVAPVCSVCIRPAQAICCANQKYDKTRSKLSEPNSAGCGLQLCATCYDMLITMDGKLCKRKLEVHAERENANKPNSLMLRADVDFICRDGLLQKAYESRK